MPTTTSTRPRYGVTQTLLDCGNGPDVNRRTVVDSWNRYEDVCVFNQHMRAWRAQDAKRLKLVVEALNMFPSGEAMAGSVRAHCEKLAKEIARRVAEMAGEYTHGRDLRQLVENQAMLVLLGWFLGDMLPGDRTDSTPDEGASDAAKSD